MKENNIYLGDAYELIKKIPDKSVDIIITDPPYEIGELRHSGITKDRKNDFLDELMETDLIKGIDLNILNEFVRVMKKINIYIWCNKNQIYDYLTFFHKEHSCKYEILIWAKSNPIPFCGNHYLVDKEYCLYFWEDGVKVDIPFERGKTVFITETNKEDKSKFKHPTVKPIEIIETLLKNSCRGGLVFDPFVGSGTTALAAKHLGLNYLGFEINEKFYKTAIERLQGINQKGEINLFDVDYD